MARPRFSATVYREAITEKLDAGLSVQRIWQDLVERAASSRFLSQSIVIRASPRRPGVESEQTATRRPLVRRYVWHDTFQVTFTRHAGRKSCLRAVR